MNLSQLVYYSIAVWIFSWMMACVGGDINKGGLDCINQMETSKGQCYLRQGNGQGQCCQVFASEDCREELTTPEDDAPPYLGFMPNSLSFERNKNQLCIHGLEMRAGDKTAGLFGFQIYLRKWHKDWAIEELSSLNFMLPSEPRLPPVVHKNPKLNPLKDVIMCIGMGTEINSTSPGVFAALEMIPLKPNKHAGPIQHPQNPISLCALDSLHLKKEGRCELKSVERNPHICEKQEKTQAQTNEIEKAITPTVHIAKTDKPDEPERGEQESDNLRSHLRSFWVIYVVIGTLLFIIGALFATVVYCWRCNKPKENEHPINTGRLTVGTSLPLSMHTSNSVNNPSYHPHFVNNHAPSPLDEQRQNLPMSVFLRPPDENYTQRQPESAYFDYDRVGGRQNQTPTEQTDYSSLPGHHYSNPELSQREDTLAHQTEPPDVTDGISSQQRFATPDGVDNSTSEEAVSLLSTGAFGDVCTGTKGCHVELSNKRDQAGNDQKEKPEASQDTSETTSHDQPIQTEGYMEDPRESLV